MASTTWNLDAAHSEVTFRVKHLVIATVSGKFSKFSSAVTTESDDFFNSEAFPNLTFVATAIRQVDGSEHEIDGHLTIRDVTQPITLKADFGGIAKDPSGQVKAGFEVEGKIKRKEFGLSWNAMTEAGGAVVSDEVKFQANVQYVRG